MNRRKHQVAAQMRAHKQWRADETRRLNALLEALPGMIAVALDAWRELIVGLPRVLTEWRQALDNWLIARHVERLQGGSDPYRRAVWWRL